MTDSLKIILRPMEPQDRNFILSTWLKGNYYGTHFGQMPKDDYFALYSRVIEEIEVHPNTQIIIACDETEPTWIVGFSVSMGPHLYWIHVKKDFRNRGIAKLMIEGLHIKTVGALTRPGRAIAEKKGLIYNPIEKGS